MSDDDFSDRFWGRPGETKRQAVERIMARAAFADPAVQSQPEAPEQAVARGWAAVNAYFDGTDPRPLAVRLGYPASMDRPPQALDDGAPLDDAATQPSDTR